MNKKTLTRREALKLGAAGLVAAAALCGGNAVYNSLRSENSNSSGLVKKLELPAGFEEVKKVTYSPIALAGQTKDAVSFLLRERGERRILRKDEPDKLGVYIINNSGTKRIGDFPVLPDYLIPQGISAIGHGNNLDYCLNYKSNNVELRRMSAKTALSDLVYKDKGISTKIEAALGDLILLRDDERKEFLCINAQKAPVNYQSVQKIKLPEGNQWKDLIGYLDKNTSPEFKELVNDYSRRNGIQKRIGAELEKTGDSNYPVMVFPNGISGDYGAIFGVVKVGSDYHLVRKKLEDKGDKK